jgi:hypothetical protein
MRIQIPQSLHLNSNKDSSSSLFSRAVDPISLNPDPDRDRDPAFQVNLDADADMDPDLDTDPGLR